jgi:predicted TPR repeat methyltransferase
MAPDFDSHLVGNLGYRTPAALKALLVDSIEEGHRFRRMLDLGCGTGLAGVALAPFAVERWGVDLSTKMLAQARSRDIYHRLEAAGIDAFLEAAEATFDLIVAADVFVYIGNLKRTFELIRRRLDDGALFLFSTEICDDRDFVLNPTGRYAHAAPYVEAVARGMGLAVLRCARECLRLEHGQVVMGNCFLLRAA